MSDCESYADGCVAGILYACSNTLEMVQTALEISDKWYNYGGQNFILILIFRSTSWLLNYLTVINIKY